MLDRRTWTAPGTAHETRGDARGQPHLARRRTGVAEPVEDFLFTYYTQRPAALRRWHPGFGVALADAPEYVTLKGYTDRAGAATVSRDYVVSQQPLVTGLRRLLAA